MSIKTYSNAVNQRQKQKEQKKNTPQTQAIPGRESEMAVNNAGGVSFKLDKWGYAKRFLILGSESSTYYTSAQKLTAQNAKNLIACAKENGVKLVDLIVEVSASKRAPKNDPALFALSIVMAHGDDAAKRAAVQAFPKVARIGTHVLHLAEFINGQRSWGRAVRRAFANIYNSWTPYELALQAEKYANRDGWTHKDVLRLAHVKPVSEDHDALFNYILEKEEVKPLTDEKASEFLFAVEQIKKTRDAKVAAKLISDHRLPREVVPTELLNEKIVWEALLPHMGMEAMVRNLATMTRVGIIAPNSDGTKMILDKMSDVEAVKKSGIHPIKVLAGLLTYKAGHGVRGQHVWSPVTNIVEGLDDLFYLTFANITPTGKRFLFAKDVSGSMGMGMVGGVIGLSPRIAAAALVAFMMRTEKIYEVIGFTGSTGGRWGYYGSSSRDYNNVNGVTKLDINSKMSLEQIIRKVVGLPFGSTDCSLPMEWARVNKIPVDAFVVTTDNETYAGARQPSQALEAYRQAMGIDAKLVVYGMTATPFTIADPKDAGMLDVVGFDTAAPSLMNDFLRGDV